MNGTSFDALAWFETLKDAGVPENQAKAQANALRDFTAYLEKKNLEELATKKDLQIEIEKLRCSLLKWQLGIGLAIAAILAKGFGWLGV